MVEFSKADRLRLNDIPEFQRYTRWLETRLSGLEGRILSSDPRDTEALIELQAQRKLYKTILSAKEND